MSLETFLKMTCDLLDFVLAAMLPVLGKFFPSGMYVRDQRAGKRYTVLNIKTRTFRYNTCSCHAGHALDLSFMHI